MANVKKIKIDNGAWLDIKDETARSAADAALPKTGGTMTGNVSIQTADTVFGDTFEGNDKWGNGIFLKDSNNKTVSSIRAVFRNSGAYQMNISSTKGSGEEIYLRLGYDAEGNPAVSASNKDLWRNAFGAANGIWPVTQGGTGLAASPSMLVNLASNTAADILSSAPRPGVTGVLPIANGGIGGTDSGWQTLTNTSTMGSDSDGNVSYIYYRKIGFLCIVILAGIVLKNALTAGGSIQLATIPDRNSAFRPYGVSVSGFAGSTNCPGMFTVSTNGSITVSSSVALAANDSTKKIRGMVAYFTAANPIVS